VTRLATSDRPASPQVSPLPAPPGKVFRNRAVSLDAPALPPMPAQVRLCRDRFSPTRRFRIQGGVRGAVGLGFR
jgi:hypothetical protein